MAQYGGDQQFVKKEGHQTDEYAHNPLHSTTADTGAMGTTATAAGGHDIGGKGTTMGTGGGYEDGKHGGVLHRTGSGSSSSSEDDGEGGRRKKKGVMEKIKEKLPGGEPATNEQYNTTSATATNVGAAGGGGGGHGYDQGEEGHEKKGLMDKIKEKLPGGKH